jgi:transcriptional regulator with XRE-family HTH domain
MPHERPTPVASYVIAQLIKLRNETGMTQGELAGALGVAQSTVSRWESCRDDPPLLRMMEWSRLLGVQLVVEMRPRQ